MCSFILVSDLQIILFTDMYNRMKTPKSSLIIIMVLKDGLMFHDRPSLVAIVIHRNLFNLNLLYIMDLYLNIIFFLK